MNAKLIVVIVLLSVFLWGVCLYNGWLYEAVVFGYNISTGWIDNSAPSISTNEKTTTVKYGKFAYRLLTDVEIPDNITTIEKNAFKGNKLTSVTIGSDVSLGENAVGYDFETVYNENGKHAGMYTRTDPQSTKWIIWYDDFGHINRDGSITIAGYNGTDVAVVIPAEIHENPVTAIGNEAFKGKNITNVTIPNTVTSIGKGAFYDNQLASITLSNSVTSIGDNAFRKNKLTRITIPNSVKDIGVDAFDENQITRISIGANVTLGDVGERGVLGRNTGFNTAYFTNNSRREGVYTRANTQSTSWTRVPR